MATGAETFGGISSRSTSSLFGSSSQLIDSETVIIRAIREFNANFGKVHAAFATAIALSGLVFIFLAAAFVFSRSAARRTSLYLICIANLFCCLHCILRMYTYPFEISSCLVRGFFMDFFEYSALYLIAAVAVNLHLRLHRKSTTPLPRYTTYLLFGIPLLVATLHLVPQYAYSGVIGMCTYAQRYVEGTTEYAIHGVFVVIFIPAILIAYSTVISLWTINKLSKRKIDVNNAIQSIIQFSSHSQDKGAMLKEVTRLQIIHKVYNDAMRAAAFPLASLAWLAMRSAELSLRNFKVKKVSDSEKLLSGMYIDAVTVPVFILFIFLLFLFDPVFGHLFLRNLNSENECIAEVTSSSNSESNENFSQTSGIINAPDTTGFEDKNRSLETHFSNFAADPVARQVFSSADAKLFFKSL